MKFEHRSLINGIAVATFLTGLANGALFCLNGDLRTAVVGSLCILFGLGYLILLRIHTDSRAVPQNPNQLQERGKHKVR
jgi:hypothetical protein